MQNLKISLHFIIISFALLLLSWVNPIQTELEVRDLLCHKWQLAHAINAGKLIPIPKEVGPVLIRFSTNGIVYFTEPSIKSKGKWTYDHHTKVVTTYETNEPERQKIIEISNQKMILEGNYDGEAGRFVFKRVQ